MIDEYIDILLEIINLVDNKIILTGSIADYFWTGYSDISDIDFVMNKTSFINTFNVKSCRNIYVMKDKLYLQQSSGYKVVFQPHRIHEGLVYTGQYKDPKNKIDIILLKDSDYIKNYSTISIKNIPIKIMTIKDRIISLSRCGYNKDINQKYSKLQDRINLYKTKYPKYI
jgi:hypothetical protein